MNRKTGPVSNSTLRRRTRADIEKRFQQIRDVCMMLNDFQTTDLHERGEVSEGLNCAAAETEYWPNYRSDERVNRAVKKAEQPGADWATHDVRILKSCDQHLEARQHLNKSLSCHTSDLQTKEESRPKQMPKAIHFLGDSDDDSGDEDHQRKRIRGRPRPSPLPPAPSIPSPPYRTPAGAPPSPAPLTQMEHQRPPDHQTPSASWRKGQCDSNTIPCSTIEVKIHQLLSLMEHMKNQQDILVAKVNYITSKLQPTAKDNDMPIPVQFPLTSLEEVESLEDWLKDPANSQLKQSLSSSLAAIGGHDTKRVTWNILAHMFHDDVGKLINWKGVNGKKSFGQMASKTLVLNSVRKNAVAHASTEHEVCKHAIRWFNLAADRGSSRRHTGSSTC